MAASRIGNSLWQAIKKIKGQVKFMLFVISWIKSYGEIALLCAEDLQVFCRPRLQRFQEEKKTEKLQTSPQMTATLGSC